MKSYPNISFLLSLTSDVCIQRAPKSSEAYRSIGGGSPIVKYTSAQSSLIEKDLQSRGLDTKVYFAMRYWHPYTEETLQQIEKDEVNTLVIIPLYPQFSISTSGSSLKLLQEIFAKEPQKWGPDRIAHTVVPAWYHRPGYLDVVAKLIIDDIADFSSEDMSEGVHVLYSAHGVPESYIQAGDPYKRHTEECVRLVSRRVSQLLAEGSYLPKGLSKADAAQLAGKPLILDSSDQNKDEDSFSTLSAKSGEGVRWKNPMQFFNRIKPVPNDSSPADSEKLSSKQMEVEVSLKKEVQYHLSFQSRVGPVKWLQPYTEEKLEELGKEKGVKNLVVVPISFVSEHIETLEEIDMEYKEVAEEFGK